MELIKKWYEGDKYYLEDENGDLVADCVSCENADFLIRAVKNYEEHKLSEVSDHICTGLLPY